VSSLPKIGTLERVLLENLIQHPKGVTYLDFPEDSPLHDEEKLDEIVCNLRNCMYEAEDDNTLKFDS
jgi:hypothetical protein